jgi:putative ABC transport system permease protein
MNLAWRDIRHNFGRFLLTCAGLALLLGVVQSMVGIYRGLIDEALVIVRAPRADIWVVEPGTLGPFAESSRIPGDMREAIARLDGVAAAGSLTFQSVEAERRGASLRLYVVGFERERPGEPSRLVAGRPITRSHFELIADRRSGLGLDERVRIGRNNFAVVGLVENLTASGGDPVVFMTLLDAQRLQFDLEPAAARNLAARGASITRSDTVNAIVARLAPTASADALVATVTRWKHLAAMTQAQQEAILTFRWSTAHAARSGCSPQRCWRCRA